MLLGFIEEFNWKNTYVWFVVTRQEKASCETWQEYEPHYNLKNIKTV